MLHCFSVLLWVCMLLLVVGFSAHAPIQLPPAASVAVSSLLYVVFAAAVAFSLITSRAWHEKVPPVEDNGTPSARSLAVLLPVSVFAQIVMGVAYRKQILGVIPHIVGAMVVALIILYVAIVLLQSFPGVRALRKSAMHLIGISSVQVILGIATYIGRVLAAETQQPALWTKLLPPVHIVVGALTLSAAVTAGLRILRNVRKPQPTPEAGWAVSQ